ncbi:hypothetical protein [Yersinia ruckeri]|uniref:hypothetical protein n=1 Tax=Yersinia ruckeri TaxID=29486 RepID=UPI0022370FB0|nr:hypothetical protein [Yersinia ruckeri]MCW6598669.1 hypothetical protein [Yersinia ruckeri]
MEIKLITSNYLQKSKNPIAQIQLTPMDYNRIVLAIRRRVKKDGDTLTGAILNHGNNPLTNSPLELVSRYYVDHGDAVVQDNLNTHVASTNVHGAQSKNTASRLIIRDATGRAEVANPINPLEIVNLQTMQAGDKANADDLLEHIVDPTNPHPNATSVLATPNMLIIRDVNARAEVGDADLARDNSIVNVKTLNTVADTKISDHNKQTNVHGATSAATASRLIIRDANGRAKVSDPIADDDIATYKMVKNSNQSLQTHIDDDSNPHPKATSEAATGGKLVIRTVTGQIKAADPQADDDVVTKKFMTTSNSDAVTAHANKTDVHGATSAATASRLIIRDANGRAQVNAPLADADIATFKVVKAVQQLLEEHIDDGTNPHAEASSYEAVGTMLALRNGSGNIQVGTAATGLDAANANYVNGQVNSLRNQVVVINPAAPKECDVKSVGGKAYMVIGGAWRQVWPATWS